MDTAARIVIRPAEPDGALAPLRAEVRAFLARVMPDRPRPLRAKSWSGFDAEFSLAAVSTLSPVVMGCRVAEGPAKCRRD